MSQFETCLALVLKHEGGYVNHPRDPGGATNKGVTQAVSDAFRAGKHLAKRSVREITAAEVAAIYERDYWLRCAADRLPKGVDYCTFDASVNSGVSRGVKWLQAALGIAADGKAGPQTIANAKAGDPIAVIKRMCAKRMGFLRGLSTFSVFGKGWTRRVVGTAGVEATSIAMASASPKATAAEESRKASNLAAAQKAGAAATGAGAGGSATQVDPSMLDAVGSAALIGVTAAVVLVVVILIAKARINRARADAHAAVAEGGLS